MADLDRELVERVARWCAEAGRTTGAAEIRAALERLGWDELLSARALLADPPPTRPLGPYALADLARGVPADLAAEREQAGRYPRGPVPSPAEVAATAEPSRPSPARKGSRGPGRATVLVRKPAPPPPPPPPAPGLPLVDELLLPHGRHALEQLLRRHGAVRPRLVAALAEGHRRADGAPIADADLDRLLQHHGQARAFLRRERDALLHALRAAGGVRARAADALGFPPDALEAALERAGAAAEAEKLREAKRRELRARGATLSDKVRLVVADPERLADLGLLADFEADLRARLPEHLKALARSGEPLALALAGSLSLPVAPVHDLATRLGLSLGGGRGALPGSRPLPPGPRAGPGERPPRGDRPRPPRPFGDRPPRADRAAGGRPSGDRAARGDRRSGGERPGGGLPGGDRPPRADRPTGARPPRRDQPAGDRSGPSRPSPSGPRAPRPSGARPSGPRSGPPAGPARPPPRGPRAGAGGARPSARGPRPGGRGPVRPR